jgi:hypothetical protein
MRHPLLVLLSSVLGTMRSLAFSIQPPSKPGTRRTIPAETEYQVLLITIFCLTGLLVFLCLMCWFPDLGAIVAEMNQF